MMFFRRTWETPTWHWRTQCSSWPSEEEAEERAGLPRGGLLCKECEALDLRSALLRLEAEEAAAARQPTAAEVPPPAQARRKSAKLKTA